eukprot:CAMPEP_0184021712 /NCGR_PEP_ID=MMETSP0954-20121128/10105_1 /TAXON_ID=627963 /ORGANISM="Aplanochytrium sp, Strain PBS07" /LENGTH=430 /DNA_ID=CAMNT_0026303811 /DNA_START=216 /DNA_END=1508 /DNA_ORIENTATION=+
MPALSPTMEEGVIALWNKKEGEEISAGESLCEIETDKATVDFELPDDGFLAKILVEAGGSPIKIGTPIGVLVEEESDLVAFANIAAESLVEDTPAVEEQSVSSTENVSPPTNTPTKSDNSIPTPDPTPVPSASMANTGGRSFASPLARKTAAESGVDVGSIPGTGPNHRVINADVLDFLQSTPDISSSPDDSQTAHSLFASAEGVDHPVSKSEQDVANALSRRKQEVPHYYLNSEIDITKLLKLRESLNADLDEAISLNDFLIRAASIVMKRVPDVNAAWHETFIRKYNYCDINVAMRTDAGILYPVVRNVESKGLAEIASETQKINSATDALEDEMFGHGTFTITNLGMYEVKSFLPIISDYQSASLGVGSISQIVVPNKDPEVDSKFRVKHVVTVSLSCDHRVVDGAVSALWLQEYKALLEDPIKMLL